MTSTRRSMRPGAAMSIAGVLLAIAGVLVTSQERAQHAARAQHVAPVADPRWVTFRDPAERWILEHPQHWTTQRFDEFRFMRVSARGLLVSNLRDERLQRVSDRVFEWDFGSARRTIVAVEISHVEGGPNRVSPENSDTRFPLSWHAAAGDLRSGLPIVSIPFVIGGDSGFSLTAWVGEAASETDKQIARRMVASVRPVEG